MDIREEEIGVDLPSILVAKNYIEATSIQKGCVIGGEADAYIVESVSVYVAKRKDE